MIPERLDEIRQRRGNLSWLALNSMVDELTEALAAERARAEIAEKNGRQDMQAAVLTSENKDAPSELEKEIMELYLRVKGLEELFGVGGNPEAEAYAGYGEPGMNSLGNAANYGRCQQAWSQAVFALESVIACGPQTIMVTKLRYKQ